MSAEPLFPSQQVKKMQKIQEDEAIKEAILPPTGQQNKQPKKEKTLY
ncbi:hypothetical protein SynA1840_00478 [Synechococcus sp. A18-40]|nr:hypothetical protein SynA1840_00478 [Synechococcus sp. A18-40]